MLDFAAPKQRKRMTEHSKSHRLVVDGGNFIEHLGRTSYGCRSDPESPLSQFEEDQVAVKTQSLSCVAMGMELRFERTCKCCEFLGACIHVENPH